MTDAISLSFHTITMKTNHTELVTFPEKDIEGFFLELVGALSIPICFWGLVANATIFWLLYSKVKKTIFIGYFLNLIIADFIISAYFLIVFCTHLTSIFVSFYFSRLMESIHSVSSNASIFLLTVICFERYIMDFSPLYYQQHRPTNFTANICCIIWFWSSLVNLILYVACYKRLLSITVQITSLCNGAMMFEYIIQIMIFVPIMFFSILFLFIRRQKKAKQRTIPGLDIILAVMVVLSFICIFTFRTLIYLSNWVEALQEPYINYLSLLFGCIKSSISPLVYFYTGSQQRENAAQPMYMLLDRALDDKENPDTPDSC
ncbi:mas-related G-protein coupled receptor member H-like [Erythrolamprus reginae]|uniref:mas-related G-protein coupled receptor member H-like n=1 Tax=Erythrolamprus reginae TaxID=121349 RepID=UPI00396C9ED2